MIGQKVVEQNHTDKVEPKFKVGDWAVWNGHIICHIDNIYQGKESLMYTINTNGVSWSNSIKNFDANAHLWTIKDAKDGDVLCTYECDEPKIVFVLKGTPKKHYALSYHYYYNIMYPYFESDSEKGCLGTDDENVKPATKEQRDLLFQKMKEAGYEWNAEKKELKKIEQEGTELPNGEDCGIDSLYHAARILEKTLGEVEGYQSDDGILEHKCAIEEVNRLYKQKPAWSEEDERIRYAICDVLDRIDEHIMKYNSQLTHQQVKDWLKSLKERMKGE